MSSSLIARMKSASAAHSRSISATISGKSGCPPITSYFRMIRWLGFKTSVMALSLDQLEGRLGGGELRVVILGAREEMTVDIEGHLDRAVAEQALHPLRREVHRDHPGRIEMAQAMEAVFRLAGAVDDA